MPTTVSSSSDAETDRVCQGCGTEGASNCVCTIIHGRETTRRLCDACLRASLAQMEAQMPPGFGFELPSLEGAVCEYCGAAANAASMNQAWEMVAREGRRFHFSCARCARLSSRLMQEALQNSPQGLSPSQQLEHIAEVTRVVDGEVRERMSPGGEDHETGASR